MQRVAVRLAYDGSRYRGFQRQPDVPTVEAALFVALDDLLDASVSRPSPPPGYSAAGRTDAGVSALAQTVALDVPDWFRPAALDAALPADVRAWAAAPAPEGFHARHDAVERSYDYYLHAPTDGHGPLRARDGAVGDRPGEAGAARSAAPTTPGRHELGAPLDEARFRAALEALTGRHDYHNLTPDDEGTVRTLALSCERARPFLRVTATAPGFCRQLVRRVVALAAAVGTGARAPAAIDRALEERPLPGHEGIAPAPPEPLVLTGVAYPDLTFERDSRAAPAAGAAFAASGVAALARHRVMARMAAGVRGLGHGDGEWEQGVGG